MSAEPSTISSLRRRGLLTAVFALAACDGDSTPIVKESGESLQLAPTNAPGGGLRQGAPATPGKDPDYKLGANDRLRITVFGQPTLTPNVSAEVITRRPFYVIGEVQKPGNYSYVTSLTAINAVAMAGGFTRRAKKNDFYIRRTSADGQTVRVEAHSGTLLQPGDTLEVRERLF